MDVGTVLAVINGPDAARDEPQTRNTARESDKTILSPTMATRKGEEVPKEQPVQVVTTQMVQQKTLCYRKYKKNHKNRVVVCFGI